MSNTTETSWAGSSYIAGTSSATKVVASPHGLVYPLHQCLGGFRDIRGRAMDRPLPVAHDRRVRSHMEEQHAAHARLLRGWRILRRYALRQPRGRAAGQELDSCDSRRANGNRFPSFILGVKRQPRTNAIACSFRTSTEASGTLKLRGWPFSSTSKDTTAHAYLPTAAIIGASSIAVSSARS